VAGVNGASPEGDRHHPRRSPSGLPPRDSRISWTCQAGPWWALRPLAPPCRPRSTARPTRRRVRRRARMPEHMPARGPHTAPLPVRASRTNGTPWTTAGDNCCHRSSCCSPERPRGLPLRASDTLHESWRDSPARTDGAGEREARMRRRRRRRQQNRTSWLRRGMPTARFFPRRRRGGAMVAGDAGRNTLGW